MPRRTFQLWGAACLLAVALAVPAAAGAATTTADLRVVVTSGATLADQSQVTGDVTIATDPGAQCFGPPGGSGANVQVPGPSALGIVKDAAETNPALRPLSVTDQFSFGLGVCGIGGFTFTQMDTVSWYLKVNHANPMLAAEQVMLRAGDQVLWYRTPGFPYPNELELVAPQVARSDRPFTVQVFAYNDGGQRSPAAGAMVTGAVHQTGPDGTTTVELERGATLQALRGADIPSNREIVCVIDAPRACASNARHKIIGTKGRDRIKGTKSPDLVKARAGRDAINTRGGLIDKVNCGRGRDRAKVGRTDIVRRCEKVIRP